jgi:FtsZ-interacting cell division protein ZipA
MDSLWVVITVVIASIAILLMGLWLVRDSKNEKKEEIK